MLSLLRRLGARLAPPPRRVDGLPAELRRFYAITDGADVPRLGVRLASLSELREGEGLLPFAASPDGAWAVVGSGPLRGWVARTTPQKRLAFRSVTALLSAMVRSVETGQPLADELSDPARSPEEQALGASIVRAALEGGDERWLELGVDLLGPAELGWLRRAAAHPPCAARARERMERLGLTTRDLPDDLDIPDGLDLRGRVARALRRLGWDVVALEGAHDLRVERDGHGSWHTVAPWSHRDDDDALAERIAERIARREERRRGAWRLVRDGVGLETADVAEAYAFSREPWSELELLSVAEGVRLRLRREEAGLRLSFESPDGSRTARTGDDPAATRAVEHMLLRRTPDPSLGWEPA